MPVAACLLLADTVAHRLTSRLLDGFDTWWQLPAAIATAVALAAFVIGMVRRDAAGLPRSARVLLMALRLGAAAAVLVAVLDVQRIAEHELVFPSRVAVLVDSSASMSLPERDGPPAATRSQRALDLLQSDGLLAALARRHEVALWRFDADAEPVALLPRAADTPDEPGRSEHDPVEPAWPQAVAPQGYETRLGEALAAVLDREPSGALAGVILLTDGGNNAGIDPQAAAARLAQTGVRVTAIGLGSDSLPANVRVADLIMPSRVFPGDAFSVTGYLQAQGLEGTTVSVELVEQSADDAPAGGTSAAGRVIDTIETALAADGELAAVRFDVPGLAKAGPRRLAVRVRPPPGDTAPGDDMQAAAVEVVDRVTRVLLMASGPGREYQFLRNVLHRDPSFEVDVLLGTAAPGMSQDARRSLDAFPPSDEALADYDAVVAIDYDWRRLEPAGWSRLERWVARQAGGLVLMAGGIHTAAWLGDPRATALRGLYPVELRQLEHLPLGDAAGVEEPMPLEFTRDGNDAEFLWLAAGSEASRVVWSEFPGVHACFPADEAKPGATIYAKVARPGATAGEPRRIYLAGQIYGSGTVLYVGSGELWRLRGIADAAYERLVAQLMRHVSHGRLLRGTQRGRLLVDRDRHAIGGTVQVRLVLADDQSAATIRVLPGRAIGPEGLETVIPFVPEPGRPGTLLGSFVVAREGAWRIEVEAGTGPAPERLTRRIQVLLPDRELAHPRLDRAVLEQLADRTAGTALFPPAARWSAAESEAIAASFPDRSRREYETGAADVVFKQRLNAALLALGGGFLCLEWVVRRLGKLA